MSLHGANSVYEIHPWGGAGDSINIWIIYLERSFGTVLSLGNLIDPDQLIVIESTFSIQIFTIKINRRKEIN